MNTPSSQTNGDVTYGSRVTIKEALVVANEELIIPPIDEEYIKNVAKARGSKGAEDVRHYFTNLLNENNSPLIEKAEAVKSTAIAERAGINQHLKELSHIVRTTDRYRDSNRRTLPWTLLARTQVTLLIAAAIVALLIGVTNNAQVVHGSGIPGFEQMWRCYLFSSISIGLALLLKGATVLMNETAIRRYTLGVWIVGFIFGVVWAILFAQKFPGFTESVADIVNNIGVATRDSHSNSGDILFIIVAILGDAFISAACWLMAEMIIERHTAPVRKNNPAYDKAHTDLDHFLKRRCEQEAIIGKINGKLQAIDEARKRFAEMAVASFNAAVASYQQAQNVLEQFQS